MRSTVWDARTVAAAQERYALRLGDVLEELDVAKTALERWSGQAREPDEARGTSKWRSRGPK